MTNFLEGPDILFVGAFDVSPLLSSVTVVAFELDEIILLLPNNKDDPDPIPADIAGAVVNEDTVVLATNGLVFAYAPKPKDPTPADTAGVPDARSGAGTVLSAV